MRIRFRTIMLQAAALAAAFAVSLAPAGPAAAAIVSATRDAAELLGWNEVGIVEQGRYADFVAVPGDPLADITLLERPSLVVKGGTVVLERR